MIRIGQIGIGHNHYDKIKAVRRYPDRFEVVGYAEDNEEWVRRRGEKRSLEGLKRMTRAEILEKCDAVLVETDVWDLTKTAQMCLDSGKHVHMDKPASGTLAEYKKLLETAEEKHLIFQPGYMYRYNPAIRKLLEMVKAGELGDISAIHAEMSTHHTPEYRRWLRNFQGGDLYIFGSHLMDLIVYLLGKPKRVLSSVAESGVDGVNGPDLSAAILEYEHAIATVFSSSLQWDGFSQRVFTVDGTLGTAVIRPIENPNRFVFSPKKEKGDENWKRVEFDLPDLDMQYRYDEMMLAFYDYVTGAKQSPFSYAHEYALQETLDQAVGGVSFHGHDIGSGGANG